MVDDSRDALDVPDDTGLESLLNRLGSLVIARSMSVKSPGYQYRGIGRYDEIRTERACAGSK